mgnify:CR=1 FL=1
MPPENGTTRREELLAVATRLFAARGYHGTRMDDVADVVGLNKATVYHYYASKSLILFDIYRRAAENTLAAVHDMALAAGASEAAEYARRVVPVDLIRTALPHAGEEVAAAVKAGMAKLK